MKKYNKHIIASLLVGAAFAQGANPPPVDVTIVDSAGKLVMKGQTNPNGTFSAGKVAAGDYVVQFKCKNGDLTGQYALVVSAGKKKVSASAVAAEQFRKGGVAMKLDRVGEGTNIMGQVAPADTDSTKVKIINGKRMIWVASNDTGSNLRGRWVEEGSKEARNIIQYDVAAIDQIQHGDPRQTATAPGR
jgi:hypothetical protein